jgi:hypothetical protein
LHLTRTGETEVDGVVPSKNVFENVRPKQANKWIGVPWASICELFIPILI